MPFKCPECGEILKTRNDFTTHKEETKHRGASIKISKEDAKKPTKKIRTKKRKKQELMGEAVILYQKCRDAGLKDRPAIKEVAKEMGESPQKIAGWLGTMKGRQKWRKQKSLPAPKKSQAKEEAIFIPTPELKFVTIRLRDYERAKESIDVLSDIEVHPSHSPDKMLISYQTTADNIHNWDYILFKYDFVEVEFIIEDLQFALNQIGSDNKLKVWDMASLEERAGLASLKETLFILTNEPKLVLTVSELAGVIDSALAADELEKDDVALVSGIWKIPPKYKKHTNQFTGRTSHGGRGGRGMSHGGAGRFNVDYNQGYTSEEEEGPRHIKQPVEKEKPEENKQEQKGYHIHPIYGITDTFICIDRLINIHIE